MEDKAFLVAGVELFHDRADVSAPGNGQPVVVADGIAVEENASLTSLSTMARPVSMRRAIVIVIGMVLALGRFGGRRTGATYRI